MIPVFPTTYFGSVLYYQKLAEHSKVLIETKEHFPKQSYRNRCDIVSADGILSLSIPVKKDLGSKTPSENVRLADNENWRARHWRAIKTAYQSAPFFDYYGIEVHDLLFSNSSLLLDFNENISSRILQWLDLPIELDRSDDFRPIQKNDPRAILVDKNRNNEPVECPYIQVFPGNSNFTPNISILDAIMCEGPLARNLILQQKQSA